MATVSDARPVAARLPAGTVEQRAHESARAGRGFDVFAKLVAIGFWGTLATLIASAAIAPGFVVLALLPLAGLPYLLFCVIALTGDRNVE